MKKVTLYFPEPQSYSRPWRGVPLPLLAISRVLAKEGYEIKIISPFLSDNPEEELLKECQDSVCLGISSTIGFQIFDGLKISKLVKEKYPDLPIVWGGWHPSVLPFETIKNKYVDMVVKGQGDRTFPELVFALERREDLNKIPGLYYKKRGKVYVNNERPLEDINDLPSLPYHLIEIEKCILKNDSERSISYVSSYGCPYRCGFCVEAIVNNRRWVGINAEKVVFDLERLVKQYHIGSFTLADNNFFVDQQRVYDICRGIIKKKLKIKLGCAAGRAPQLVRYNPEVWEVMEKSGISSICTGAESGLTESLELMEKDMQVEDVVKLTELCRKYHIRILYGFMLGVPWSKNSAENKEFIKKEFQATLSLISKLLKISDKNKFLYYVYLPYPGSPLFERAVSLGLTYPKSLAGWSKYLLAPEDGFKKVVRQKWISASEVELVNMLNQYIFAVLDPASFSTLCTFSFGPKKLLFSLGYYLCYFLVKIRWTLRFFSFPLDYRIFNYFRKNGYFS